ncbi:MAG: hypothetical protein V2I33_18925, partial [Kangiellaceae bacterium]|nr:hypothetical protein [Kangiellaceae bacterium]
MTLGGATAPISVHKRGLYFNGHGYATSTNYVLPPQHVFSVWVRPVDQTTSVPGAAKNCVFAKYLNDKEYVSLC